MCHNVKISYQVIGTRDWYCRLDSWMLISRVRYLKIFNVLNLLIMFVVFWCLLNRDQRHIYTFPRINNM